MAKRKVLSRSELATPAGAALLALCRRLTTQGELTESGIRELIHWLKANREVQLPARSAITKTMIEILRDDRKISPEESQNLYRVIESLLPAADRKIAVQNRKQKEVEKRRTSKAQKEQQKLRKQTQREKDLAAAGVVFLTAKNGRKYQLHTLVGQVEYGHEDFASLATRLGEDVAAVVEQAVRSRERHLEGYIVKDTGAAWLFRLTKGGDHYLPARSTRILKGFPPGPLVVAVSPSIAAEIDQRQTPRNLLSYSTKEVSQRLGVSVEQVRKWIREGYLGASQNGNGSAAFEYSISEPELLRFAKTIGR